MSRLIAKIVLIAISDFFLTVAAVLATLSLSQVVSWDWLFTITLIATLLFSAALIKVALEIRTPPHGE